MIEPLCKRGEAAAVAAGAVSGVGFFSFTVSVAGCVCNASSVFAGWFVGLDSNASTDSTSARSSSGSASSAVGVGGAIGSPVTASISAEVDVSDGCSFVPSASLCPPSGRFPLLHLSRMDCSVQWCRVRLLVLALVQGLVWCLALILVLKNLVMRQSYRQRLRP